MITEEQAAWAEARFDEVMGNLLLCDIFDGLAANSADPVRAVAWQVFLAMLKTGWKAP